MAKEAKNATAAMLVFEMLAECPAHREAVLHRLLEKTTFSCAECKRSIWDLLHNGFLEIDKQGFLDFKK